MEVEILKQRVKKAELQAQMAKNQADLANKQVKVAKNQADLANKQANTAKKKVNEYRDKLINVKNSLKERGETISRQAWLKDAYYEMQRQ